MIPVYQTAFGGPDSPTPGDCFRACVASILELPIDEVPHFCAAEEWIPPLQAWFRERGWMPLLVAGDIGCWLLDAYHVAAGPGAHDSLLEAGDQPRGPLDLRSVGLRDERRGAVARGPMALGVSRAHRITPGSR